MLKFWAKERIGTFILFGIVIIVVIVGVIQVNNHKKNAVITEYEDYVPRETNMAEKAEIGEYKSIAKNDKLELFYEDVMGTIQVKNLENGHLWKGVVDEEVYAKVNKSNAQWKHYMKSAFSITLNDLDNRDAKPATMYAHRDVDWIETTYIENGVSVEYGLTEQGVFITIEYILDGENLLVRIPYDGITEETKYIVNTIEVLPFFGAAGDEINGYMMYPDGSGAITVYENKANRIAGNSAKIGQWRAYSNKAVTMLDYLDPDNYERYTAALPVYGLKNNDNAVLVAFTNGAEGCGILGSVSGMNNVNLYRMSFEAYMRNVFDITMSNVTGDKGAVTTGATIQRVDDVVIPVNKEIRYFFLSDEEATYSGMADTYRDYLMETGQLNDLIDETEDIPLALDFLMGVTEEQLIMEKYIKMTSLEDLTNILARLEANGIDTTKTVLKSWTKSGELPPNYWPVANQIGGKSGLEELNDYLTAHAHNDVYLNIDMITAVEENGDFSTVNDVVFTGVNLPVNIETETSTMYLLSPEVAAERTLDLLDKLADCDRIGLNFEYMGRVVYPDYNEDHMSTRGETIEMWKKIYETVKADGRPVGTEGLNQYNFASADYLTDVALESFGLAITDNSIPFVQMVISGCINYSAKPGNLASDLDIQKLQWIEFGALPYFYLTQEDSVLLKETDYNDLFTSTFDVWEERVVETYKDYQSKLQCVYGKQMTEHKIISEDVRCLTYENGVKVYLNYNTEDAATYEGVTIPAKGYIVVGGGE